MPTIIPNTIKTTRLSNEILGRFCSSGIKKEEFSPTKCLDTVTAETVALEAAMEGYRVMPIAEAAPAVIKLCCFVPLFLNNLEITAPQPAPS